MGLHNAARGNATRLSLSSRPLSVEHVRGYQPAIVRKCFRVFGMFGTWEVRFWWVGLVFPPAPLVACDGKRRWISCVYTIYEDWFEMEVCCVLLFTQLALKITEVFICLR